VKSIYALPLMVMFAVLLIGMPAWGQEGRIKVSPDWKEIIGVSKTNVSIQVCPEPPMRRGYPIHDQLFKALHDLGADYARLQPWFPYPKMGVAELRPPQNGKTFWDFTLMDQITEDFMQATAGHTVVFSFGTIPRWMFTTRTPLRYPANPDDIDWTYISDKALNDSTVNLFAAYQARVAGWYLNGGFEDEAGRWHSSEHHYKVDYWEVLNEADGDHSLTPAQYTQFYDAVVEAVRKVAPGLKFMGPALADSTGRPDYIIYFLDPKNHRPGIPVDALSYHFYSMAALDETPEVMQYTIFDQADNFLTTARYIDAIRKQLSPNTLTAVDELGSQLSGGMAPDLPKPIPKSYWNLAGAMWAYIFGHLTRLGVDVVNGAELIDYPGQVASSTLIDWNTGEPNARYWVVKLLRDNFGPGDRIAKTGVVDTTEPPSPFTGMSDPDLGESLAPVGRIYGQAFVTAKGQRRLLLVNKRDRAIDVTVSGAAAGTQQTVEESTTSAPIGVSLSRDLVHLPPLGVAVVTLPQ
jgi:hypothetical protein